MHAIKAVRRLAADRPLAALVGANAISSIGDWLYLTILPVLVFRQTGDLALVGIVGALRLAPWLLLSVPAGVLVDRVRPERLLLVTESIRAGLMLLMAALTLLAAPVIAIVITATVAVAVGTFAMPAHGRLIPMVARDDASVGTANAVNSAFDNLACILGPMLAALALATAGPAVGLVVNGLSFVVMALILHGISREARARYDDRDAGIVTRRTVPDQTPGGGLVAIARAAGRGIMTDAAISLASGALWVMPVALTAQLLHADDSAVGLLNVFAGMGGIVGAALAAARIHASPDRAIAIGLASLAASLAACAAGASPVVAVLAITIASTALVAVDTLNLTHVQRTADPARLGRTLGILHTSAAAWAALGSLAVSYLLPLVGLGATCVSIGMFVTLVGFAPTFDARRRELGRRRAAGIRARPAGLDHMVRGARRGVVTLADYAE